EELARERDGRVPTAEQPSGFDRVDEGGAVREVRAPDEELERVLLSPPRRGVRLGLGAKIQGFRRGGDVPDAIGGGGRTVAGVERHAPVGLDELIVAGFVESHKWWRLPSRSALRTHPGEPSRRTVPRNRPYYVGDGGTVPNRPEPSRTVQVVNSE